MVRLLPADDPATDRRWEKIVQAYLAAQVVVWTAVSALQPNAPLDVVEMLFFGREWQWGFFKHPPLPAWIAEVAFRGSGGRLWSVYLASQLAIATCGWAVWKLGRALVPARDAAFAALLLAVSWNHTFAGMEFNHNVCLYPWWTLTILASHFALTDGRLRHWIATGFCLGMAGLAKYTAATLAVSLLAFLLVEPTARRWWRRPEPYLAALTALAVCGPHLWWAAAHGFPTIGFALSRTDGQAAWGRILGPLSFAAAQGIVLVPMLAAVAPVLARPWRLRALAATELPAWRFLTTVVVGPFVVCLLVGMVGGRWFSLAHGSQLWPFAGLLALFSFRRDAAPRAWHRAWTIWGAVTVALLGVAVGRNLAGPFLLGKPSRVHFPGPALADRVEEIWRSRHPGPLPALAGEWWLAANVAAYGPSRPPVWGGSGPDRCDFEARHAAWMSAASLRRTGGVILWNADRSGVEPPAFVTDRFPEVVALPPIELPWQTRADVTPVRVGVAVLPPGAVEGARVPGHPPRSWRLDGRTGILKSMAAHRFSKTAAGLAGVMAAAGSLTGAAATPFAGWQGMRVIPLDGRADRVLVADLGRDGRDDVVVVNPRQARLDIYRWLAPDERTRADAVDPDRPNELPLAPEWSRGEVSIDEMPIDAVAHDLDGDARPELLVLTSPSNRVAIYAQAPGAAADGKGAWIKTGAWDLLAATPTGKEGCLLVRDLPGGRHELLVSCEQGIQQLPLVPGSRAVWLTPREIRPRLDWHLADLDGDGDRDLVEWSNVARQVVRWFPCGADGSLLAAQTLHDRGVEGMRTTAGPQGAADLLLLGGSDKGVLRRYRLARGDATAVGRHDALPMAAAAKRGWCGMLVGDDTHKTPAIVAVDAAQPRLRLHRLGESGWLPEETFPAIGGIRALAAPAARPGLLLVWAKDAADLHRCRWENGRLTYPQPWEQDGADRRLLALDTVGTTVWWAQRVGADLDLFVWPADSLEPRRTRFPGLGPKVDQVVWLGGETVLVQDAFATAGRLVRLVEGKSVVTSPALLAKMDPGEYLLLEVGGALRKARLTDGVLQWLGDDLHPVDQVMLADGQKIAAYLPVAGDTGPAEAWALEQDGAFLHRLRADEAGVMRVVESVKPPAGTALRGDHVLGVVLVDQDRIVRLSHGRPWALDLLESVDGRIGRRSGVSESTIHRVLVTDLDGDGHEDAALCDDRRHQLTALLRAADGGLQRSVTWQVFEDRKYPYDGGDSKDLVAEPRRIVALDADGDGGRDLALVSQDRLVIYLARDPEAP